MSENPYLVAGRARKSAAIAEVLWRRLGPEDRDDPNLRDRLVALEQRHRDTLATMASGTDPRTGKPVNWSSPSEECWDEVVVRIDRMRGTWLAGRQAARAAREVAAAGH